MSIRHTNDIIGLHSQNALAGGKMYELPPPVCAALPFCRLHRPMKIDQEPVNQVTAGSVD
jgi:hypothetical protein